MYMKDYFVVMNNHLSLCTCYTRGIRFIYLKRSCVKNAHHRNTLILHNKQYEFKRAVSRDVFGCKLCSSSSRVNRISCSDIHKRVSEALFCQVSKSDVLKGEIFRTN